MKKQLTKDLHFFLGEYQKKFSKLKTPQEYAGSIALIEAYEQIKEGEGDAFFEKFGVGNDIFSADNPFERALAYESLLHILHEHDNKQYLRIHKGTPYFFLAWTAFQQLDFEKALFYMDAAVSEDLRKLKALKSPPGTQTPAMDFMLLNPQGNSVGVVLNAQLQSVIVEVLRDFKNSSGIEIRSEEIVDSFLRPLLLHENKQHRSIITALYCFFIESGRNKRMIKLRSSEGGSIDPLLSHLFKGARILESLLELKSGKLEGLYQKILNLKVPLSITQKNLHSERKTFKEALSTFEELQMSGKSFQDCNFATSYIIRNTTGHSLIWSDEFKDEKSYTILYQALTNSILWSIYQLWIK